MDLHDSGKDMDPSMIKSLFLSKIQDKEYKYLMDAYINDPTQDFESCAQHFLEKWEWLTAANKNVRSASSAATNNSSQGIKLTPAFISEWKTE